MSYDKGYFMIVYPQFPQQNYIHIIQVSRALESFDVEERHMSTVETVCPNVKVIHKPVASLDTDNHVSTILSRLIKSLRVSGKFCHLLMSFANS